jgi:hypothetical protein
VPFGALPTAVRTADTITASFIKPSEFRIKKTEVPTFFKRAFSDVQKTDFVRFFPFLEAFSDIGWNRNRSSAKIAMSARKVLLAENSY